jgi:hypothetical protein
VVSFWQCGSGQIAAALDRLDPAGYTAFTKLVRATTPAINFMQGRNK